MRRHKNVATVTSGTRPNMAVLVTGAAGFIGFHTCAALLARGDMVVGVDNINDYYDPALKHARLAQLESQNKAGNFTFVKADIADESAVDAIFAAQKIDRVIHLAAQAGVRYSLENPRAYVASNIVGFTNIIEACRHNQVAHLTYASTSSVYGGNTSLPYRENSGADHPLQFYAATKRANELMAHAYSHLYGLPTTGLRFFTVYGPWGRPDMSPYLFTKAIFDGTPIQVFNNGNHSRDFTYVGDIVEGIIRASDSPAQPNPDWDSAHPDPSSSTAPYRIYNIGNADPVNLADYIKAIEVAVGKKAVIELLPLQPGDVPDTFADVSALKKAINYQPKTPIQQGVQAFVDWYRKYHDL
jgi:UDP-glucuronate 4-epimerase